MKDRKTSACKGEDNRDKGQNVNFCLMDGRQNSSNSIFIWDPTKRMVSFVHNKFMQAMKLWYYVNGIISNTVKSVIPFILFLLKTKSKAIDNTLIALLCPVYYHQ